MWITFLYLFAKWTIFFAKLKHHPFWKLLQVSPESSEACEQTSDPLPLHYGPSCWRRLFYLCKPSSFSDIFVAGTLEKLATQSCHRKQGKRLGKTRSVYRVRLLFFPHLFHRDPSQIRVVWTRLRNLNWRGTCFFFILRSRDQPRCDFVGHFWEYFGHKFV